MRDKLNTYFVACMEKRAPHRLKVFFFNAPSIISIKKSVVPNSSFDLLVVRRVPVHICKVIHQIEAGK